MTNLYHIENNPDTLYHVLSWIGEEVKLQPIDGGPIRVVNGSFVVQKSETKTHCVNGHEFTPDNTKWIWDGRTKKKHRRCVKCKRKSDLEYFRRKNKQ